MTKKLSLALLTISMLTFSLPIAHGQSVVEEDDAAMEETAVEATTPTASQAAPQTEGFTMVPADPNSISPRKFLFEIKPGDIQTETVTIQNLSNEAGTFFLYGADSTLSAQGTPAYKTRQNGGTGEGDWIQFEDPRVELNPQEKKEVQFTLSVPKETDLDDYRIGIAMEKTKEDANNPNITIATRYIIHAAVKVTNDPQPVPKVNGEEMATGNNEWQTYYFYISLSLFIASFLALIWVTVQERKEKMEARESRKANNTATTKKNPSTKKTATKPASKRKTATKRKSTAKKTTTKSKTTKKKTPTKKKSPAKKRTTTKKKK